MPVKNEIPLPDLFIYEDYRAYLRDRICFEKQKKGRFSYRHFASLTGFGSNGYIKMITDGKRNISPKSIGACCKGLSLAKKEAAYFEALVLFNQAKDEKSINMYWERLIALRPKAKHTLLERSKYNFFTKKHYVIIREMVTLPTFVEDPNWIAANITPVIRPKDAEEAIATLLRLGLICRTDNGKLVQTEKILRTPANIAAREIYVYHANMLGLARHALLKGDPNLRDISALTVPIPEYLIPKIKERIQEFRHDLLELINSAEPNFHEVFQVNIQCFPITKVHTPTPEASL